jgi:hypothetical protein
MATVGSLNVVLSANTAEFTTKLESAAKKTKSFGQSLGGRDDMLKSLGISSGAITAISTGFTAATAAAGAMVAVGREAADVFTHVAETVGEWVAQSAEAIDSADKMAGALGITTEAFMSLGAAAKKEAGVEGEQFAGVLLKMSKSLGEASIKGGEVEDSLGRMGLKLRDVTALPVDKQFTTIAEAISKLGTPMEKVSSATAIFGKEGGALLPLLNQGAAGIEEMRRKALDYGTAVRQIDAGSISAMNDQLEEVGMQWTGIKNTIAISLAPSIAGVAAVISQTIPPAVELRNMFESAMIYTAAIADSLGTAADVASALAAGNPFAAMQAFNNPGMAFTDFLEVVQKKANEASHTVAKIPAGLADIADSAGSARQSVVSMVDSLKMEAATAGMSRLNKTLTEMIASGHATAQGIREAAEAIQHIEAVASGQKVKSYLQNLQDSVDSLNMSEMGKVFKTMTDMGASGDEINKALSLEKIIEQAKDMKSWQEKIRQEWENNMTPLERYAERMREIQEMASHGMAPDLAKRLAGKAHQDLLNSDPMSNDPGIVHAREVRFGNMPAMPRRNSVNPPILTDRYEPAKSLTDTLNKKQPLDQQQLTELKTIVSLLRDLGGSQVFDIGG